MLQTEWLLSNGTFNPRQDQETLLYEAVKRTYKNLKYYTLPFEVFFENIDESIIYNDIEKQKIHIQKELTIFTKHWYFNKVQQEKIGDIYENFYYYEGYFFKTDELSLWLNSQKGSANTFIKAVAPEYDEEIVHNEKKQQVITISREAIRKITQYSPYVVPKWGTKQVYIEWQDVILQDDSAIILVDGSRQIWKSLTIAEKAVELSFIPNEDTLVWAFIKKTTDVIRNYILRHIRKFDEWVFVHYKSEWYILNTKSGTKIYFRTLDNGAQNVLGLTLKNIIVDEAQLIDTEVFEDVLEPTISTTDGRMILIGTPWFSAKGYYYDLIMECKRWIEKQGIKIAVKCESNPDLSYYQIDITQNPLIAPRLRAKVMANQDKASVQRQYFCNWNSGQDRLFKPKEIYQYPTLTNSGYFVITFDPARSGTDRSAYTVSYTCNSNIYIILSGFIPKEHKKQWSRQINFYAKWIIKSFSHYKNLSFWVDLRGLGEWFHEAFTNYFRDKERYSIIKISYTSGDAENITGLDWKVSKTRLITNATDLIDEWIISVISSINKDLLEEFNFIYEDEDRRGNIGMKSAYKDDITNSFLTNMFIVKKRGFLKRSVLDIWEKKEDFWEWSKTFTENTTIKKKIKRNVW